MDLSVKLAAQAAPGAEDPHPLREDQGRAEPARQNPRQPHARREVRGTLPSQPKLEVLRWAVNQEQNYP